MSRAHRGMRPVAAHAARGHRLGVGVTARAVGRGLVRARQRPRCALGPRIHGGDHGPEHRERGRDRGQQHAAKPADVARLLGARGRAAPADPVARGRREQPLAPALLWPLAHGPPSITATCRPSKASATAETTMWSGSHPRRSACRTRRTGSARSSTAVRTSSDRPARRSCPRPCRMASIRACSRASSSARRRPATGPERRWSRRRTLFGGDAHGSRNSAELDPKVDAAKIRAFFIDPDHARQGIGKAILERCEAEAVAWGFSRFELMATLPGVRLYRAMGYVAGETVRYEMETGVFIEFVGMGKII